MTSLLPPNTTALERALEKATARISDVPTPIETTWNPDTLRADLLAYLAYGLSVDTWSAEWPESVIRSRVRHAIAIQRRKGTVKSVREVVESFRGDMAIREWWQLDPPGNPHSFEIVLSLSDSKGVFPADYIDSIIAEVARTKPARSHFTFSQGLNGSGSLGVAAAARPTVYARLQLPTAALSLTADLATCAAARPAAFIRLTSTATV